MVQGRYKPERPDAVLVLLTVLKRQFCSLARIRARATRLVENLVFRVFCKGWQFSLPFPNPYFTEKAKNVESPQIF